MRKKVINVLRPVRQEFILHPELKWYTDSDRYAHKRVLRLNRGIYIMEDWWRSKHVTIKYDITDYNQYYLNAIPLLASSIQEFHHIIAPHQKIEYRHLVFGLGATQLLHAAIYAYCVSHARHNTSNRFINAPPLYFTHQTPGYLDTKEVIESFNEFNAKWVNFENLSKVAPENLVEIITSPNNPDSRLLKRETNSKYIISDRVNLWPFFMTNSKDEFYKETLENDEVSIFSLAKIFSFSGTRAGYAFVKDPKVAEYMKYFIMISTHGISGDGQIRCLMALRFLLNQKLVNEYVKWITDQFISRWQIVKNLVPHTEMELLNNEGAGIWVKTPIEARKFLYDQYKILGTYGPEYGVGDNYARLNMQCTGNEFKEFIYRLS